MAAGGDPRGALVRWVDPRVPGIFDPAAAVAALTDAERRRCDALDGPERRSFLAGRALARATVAELLGADPVSIVLSARCARCGQEHGRPLVDEPKSAKDLGVSISRGPTAVAVAVIRGRRIGIDVEAVSADRFAGVEDVALGPLERRAYDRMRSSERLAALAAWWTRKEAILKATGDGLRVDPRSLELSTPGARGPIRRLDPSAVGRGGLGGLAGLQVQDLKLADGLAASVAFLPLPDLSEFR